MAAPKVTKCICHDRTFEEIRDYARQQQYTDIRELRQDRYCSCSCGMCIPYVEMVLATGETAFEVGAFYKQKR